MRHHPERPGVQLPAGEAIRPSPGLEAYGQLTEVDDVFSITITQNFCLGLF